MVLKTSWKPNKAGEGSGRWRAVDDDARGVEQTAKDDEYDDRGIAGPREVGQGWVA